MLNFISLSTFVITIREIFAQLQEIWNHFPVLNLDHYKVAVTFGENHELKETRWAQILFTFNKVQNIPRKTTGFQSHSHILIFFKQINTAARYIRWNQRIADSCFSFIAINKITTIFFHNKKFHESPSPSIFIFFK